MLTKLLPLALFVAISVFLWKGLALDPGKLPSPLIDRPAPAFTVATLPRDDASVAAPASAAGATTATAATTNATTTNVTATNAAAATATTADSGDPAVNGSVAAPGTPGAMFDSEAMAGQVWLLNIWASWCGPCAQEHPQLVSLAQRRDVPIVGLNYKDDPAAARDWLARYGDIFSDVLSDVDGKVGLDWGVYGVPETFVIDAEGQVRYKHVGPILPDDLEGTLLPVIDSLTGSPS